MTQDTLFDSDLGKRAKEAGQHQAEFSDRAWPWRARALDAIQDLAAAGQPFTADDVVARVGLPDVGTNRNNAVGAVFSSAARRGVIVPTGVWRKSRRVISHSRHVAVWVGNPDLDF